MARILIVEDDLAVAEDVADYLSAQNHSTETVNDGEAAYEKLKNETFDLVILDIDLPKMSGVDVCKSYRSEGGLTAILMLTGRGEIEDKEVGLDAGADDYLVKPFHLKELLARVKALLRRVESTAAQVRAAEDTAREKPAPKPLLKYKQCLACETRYPENSYVCPVDGSELIECTEDPLIGSIVGEHYQIESAIARGGMSTVYKAKHKYIDRVVAVKFIAGWMMSESRNVLRFRQEAQAVARLRHPNLIALYDFGITEDGRPYMITDYVPGRALSEILSNESKLKVKRAVNLCMQVCEGIAYAHEQGLIHRDLKPANIMVDSLADGSELVRVVDFGIAKVLPKSDEDTAQLTIQGELFGTCYYMSPEQCRGKDPDARSDVYSLGCVLYEVLTGHPPVKGENQLDTIQMQVSFEPPPVSARAPEQAIPKSLEKLVMKALAKDPQNRQQSINELLQDLKAV